jgi:hypothetical protein
LKNIKKHKVKIRKIAYFQPFFAHKAHKTNETKCWFSGSFSLILFLREKNFSKKITFFDVKNTPFLSGEFNPT